MRVYFSTFITGFSAVVEQALRNRIHDVQIESLSDGIVIYKTNTTIDALKQLRFFNNSFILINKIDNLPPSPINFMIKAMLKDDKFEEKIRTVVPRKGLRFRVRASIENQFVAIDNNLLRAFEEKAARAGKIVLDRSLPDIEFWFTTRREGFGLVALRFTRRSNYEKTLEKGELYPEVAELLCIISEPKKDDVFLDPFSGSGAIPITRAIDFPYKTVYAGDIENKLVEKMRIKAKKVNKKIVIGRWNALHLDHITDNSIDKIVTDPPWGLHSGKELNLDKFYEEMLSEFWRVLTANGLVVVLVAKKDLFETVLKRFSGKFNQEVKYDTLVSGQKAGAYKLRKL